MTEAGGLVSCAQGRTLHTRKWERKEISSLSCAREQRSRRRPTPHLCVAAFEHVDTGSGSATTFLPTSAASLPRPAVAPQSALCLCWGSSGGLCNSRPLRPGQLHTSALAAHAPPCPHALRAPSDPHARAPARPCRTCTLRSPTRTAGQACLARVKSPVSPRAELGAREKASPPPVARSPGRGRTREHSAGRRPWG